MSEKIQDMCLASRELALGASKLSNYIGCLEKHPQKDFYEHLLSKVIVHIETALDVLHLQHKVKEE